MSDITNQLPPAAELDPDAAPRPARGAHPNFWWSILWCVGVTLCTQVPGGVAAAVILVAWLMIDRGAPQGMAELMTHPVGQAAMGVAILIAHGLMIVLSVVALRLVAGPPWPRQVAWRPPAWHHVPVVLLLWPAFSILAGGLYYFLRHVLHVPSVSDFGIGGMEEIEKTIQAWPLPLGVFLIGVLPAFSEELWCRGFLGRGIVATHGYVLGVLGTSFLFGLIHGDPCQGLMAVGMGVGLHVVYLLTRSLWMPILLHFLNNSLAVVLTRFPAAAAIEKEFTPWHALLYAAAALAAGAGVAALAASRARLRTPRGEPAWRPDFPGVELPPEGGPTVVGSPPPPLGWVLLTVAGLVGVGAALAMILSGAGG